MSFENLGLIEPLLRSIRDKRFTNPTEIQSQTIPFGLAGRDILGCAQTGTGKTAAFALPILQHLTAGKADKSSGGPRVIQALVLAPTRELAAQIGESFADLGRRTGLKHTVIFGGVGQHPQCKALQRGVDILVATPGRLLDLMGQGYVSLTHVKFFVLDEADRMLDMGFIHDIRRVVTEVPADRQTMLFSATVPREIAALSETLLREPAQITVAPEAPAAETVDQSVYLVERTFKQDLLHQLIDQHDVRRSIVFTRTKHGADRVARRLDLAGYTAGAMHSGKSQNARLRTLKAFRDGSLRVLVASDIAARGIDVADISHVFNFDMPGEAETYVHRIGRTGRAGRNGFAFSFCGSDERDSLRDIERLLGKRLPSLRVEAVERAETPRKHDAEGGASRAGEPGPGSGLTRRNGQQSQRSRGQGRRGKANAAGVADGARGKECGAVSGGGKQRRRTTSMQAVDASAQTNGIRSNDDGKPAKSRRRRSRRKRRSKVTTA